MADWERGARLLNDFRVIPRIIIFAYYTFFMYAWFFVVNWFIVYDWDTLPKDPTIGAVAVAAVAGFPAVILGILTKVLKDLTEGYWSYKPPHHEARDGGSE